MAVVFEKHLSNNKRNLASLFIISNVVLNGNLSNALPSQLCGKILAMISD